MRKEINLLRQNIYRATSIIFVFLLLGALGAGAVNFINIIFKTNILGAASADFWHLFFWATDFFLRQF